MLPAAYRRSSSNPSPRGAMMRRVPPRGESVMDLFDEVVRSQVIDRKAPTVEAVQVHRVDKNTTAKAAVAPRAEIEQ